MCGISGFVFHDPHRPVQRDVLARMGEQLRHRGPDDEGLFVGQGVGLAFRRLSIIDLESGHQPMSNEDGSIWIVFNGEIYNHAELREVLVAKGHCYRTRSDTETIIHLFEEEGIDGLSRLNGMFAFAIWESKPRRLLLVRDRLGVKPLYYYSDARLLIFGSEVKAVLAHPGARHEVNAGALEEYCRFRHIAGSDTLLQGVHSLLPGHLLVAENGQTSVRKYWDLPIDCPEPESTDGDASEELDSLLEDSVRLRLVSDVPVGTMCSGGLDSSLVTAYAVRAGLSGVNTYSVAFREAEFDESAYAATVASQYATTHHKYVMTARVYADLLPEMIWHGDEPLHHENSVAIYAISRLAKERVTVILTGEGADELFLGYPRYQIVRAACAAQAVPEVGRRVLGALLERGPRKMALLGDALRRDEPDAILENSAVLRRSAVRGFLSREVPESDLEYRRSLISDPRVGRLCWDKQLTYVECKTYLVSVLTRMDKMSMAASIEGRVPFLDYRIAEWAFRLPRRQKLVGRQSKRIVRRLGERLLERRIVHRAKSGFGVPIGAWLRDESGLGRYLDLLRGTSARSREFVLHSEVEKMIVDHRAGVADHGAALWPLVNIELWLRMLARSKTA